ncbi:MAG: NAD synthetase, partial [Rhodospirillaceae bacterium]|nr:NAD synthetase [Rhodospirillaceae bacterium]
MSANLAAIAYLVAAVCFILALKGLSSPTSSRQGNMIGIAGMVIAAATTIANPSVVSYTWIIAGLVLGGGIGVVIALKIQMTAMPQLVAAFHSLVGMAAVLVAASAYYAPEAYGILDVDGAIKTTSSIEMILGMAIGAIT